MESQNAKSAENEEALEASVVDNDKNSGKDEEMVVEAEKDENEVVETSDGEKSKENEKFVEAFVDVKPEEAALKVVVEENKIEDGIVGASSSGMKKPQGLRPKTRIVKKVKKLVKRKVLKGTAVQVASEKNVTVEQSAEPSLGGSEKVMKSAADSPQRSSGKDKDSESCLGGNDKELEESAEAPQLVDDDENVVGAESSGKESLKEVKGKASIVKSVGKRLQKGKNVKGTLTQGMDEESEGPKEGVDLDSIVAVENDVGASLGENMMEAEKAIECSVEASGNELAVVNKQPSKLKAKAKLRKTPAAPLVKPEADKGTPQLENDDSLGVKEQRNGEGDQEKTIAEKIEHNQLTEDKNGLLENKRRKRKRRGKQVFDSNKKQQTEVVSAADATQLRIEERKEHVDPKEGEVKIGGLIFMCNSKTRPDCFRFSVMGVQEGKKNYVMGIKPGLKLFLYDYDLKLLYGIFEASSKGGMKLERNAFGGSFPAQVRFKIFSDCIPLPESQFKKAIKENYNNRNKFKTELTHKQVFKLKKLFRPAPLPAQVNNHIKAIPLPRNADRKRSDRDRYASGSIRTHLTHTNERRRNASPPPRREEPPRDLYLSEREYRTYGLRRPETSQNYPIPPPVSSYHRDRLPLDSYHPSLDHDRLPRHAETPLVDHDLLLRHAEIDRHHHDRSRDVRLPLPEREYRSYDHLSSRHEILARHSPDPPPPLAATLDSYRRDPYYSYDHRAPERQPPRTYLTSSRRQEEDDLYSRYVTPDSLAEYYRSSSSLRRYPSTAESELPTSSIVSRYAYSHRL